MKIVVLTGGYSPEREVALTSGCLIANALCERGHRVLLLDVYEGLPELPYDPETLFRAEGGYSHTISEEVPDLVSLKARVGNGDALIGRNVIKLCRMADKVFLALHGAMGENGQLQATLDSFGIGYTGSGYDGSLLAMDKDLSKRLLRDAGIRTPEWVFFDTKTDAIGDVLMKIGLPCVVKPCSCGSSVGISMADNVEQLRAALSLAAAYGERVLVERKIVGRELTVGVLGGVALPAIEIIPKTGFYDYKNKYQGSTEEICPAPISAPLAKELSEISLRAFSVLRLRGYARFDFLLDAADRLWCLEANTLPGMTPTSLLPLAAKTAGISYPELCERILRGE